MFWALILALFVIQCNSSHIRGGFATWRVQEQYGNGTVLIKSTARYHIRTSSCPYATWTPYWQLTLSGATGLEAGNSYQHTCADERTSEGWTSTQLVQYILQDTTDAGVMSLAAGAWISDLSGYTGSYPSDFSIPYLADLRVNNNGRINSAPVALIQPVVKFMSGCASIISIPTMDEDGDSVTCRFAQDSLEGGDIINMNYPHLSLTGNGCSLQYAGTAIHGLYPVALIVEDSPTDNPSVVKSYSSLQFLVDVSLAPSSGYSCTSRPVFGGATPADNQKTSIAVGQTLTLTLQAKPVSNSHSITEFGLIAPNYVTRSPITRVNNNNEYASTVTWIPTDMDAGPNYFCFEARESTGLVTEQRCITVTVGDTNPCQIENGGCSDTCVSDGGAGYHCVCQHSCWELLEDQRQCVPKMVRGCTQDRMMITVEECAVDGKIGIGDFDPDNMNQIASECRNIGNNTHHHFDFGVQDCGTQRIETADEVKHRNTIKMWIDYNLNAAITRGEWLYIDYTCSVQKYANVSGVFDPQDTSTTVIIEDGFAEIQMAFDFYTDSTFQTPYGPADYPREYDLNEKIYFGLYAESADDDIELFTDNCTAYPEPLVDGYFYEMISGGCLQDATMAAHPSPSPKRNHFSIDAFRFNDNLPHIDTTTDVAIVCEVVICVQGNAGTRCASGCVSSFLRSAQSPLIRRAPKKNFNLRGANDEEEEEEVEESSPPRDPSIKETGPISLTKSPTIKVKGSGSNGLAASGMMIFTAMLISSVLLK